MARKRIRKRLKKALRRVARVALVGMGVALGVHRLYKAIRAPVDDAVEYLAHKGGLQTAVQARTAAALKTVPGVRLAGAMMGSRARGWLARMAGRGARSAVLGPLSLFF